VIVYTFFTDDFGAETEGRVIGFSLNKSVRRNVEFQEVHILLVFPL